jgi:hypothetical protein
MRTPNRLRRKRYRLVNSRWTRWADWNPPNGRYIVSSTNQIPQQGAVGHMIGVTVTGGTPKTKTITDRQQLSPGTGNNAANFTNFHIRYVFHVN